MGKRIQYYDNLRIIAIIMAIVIHVSMAWWGVSSLNSTDFLFANLFNSLSRCGVPIMVMLSGALLIRPNHKENFSSIKRRVQRITQAFLFWSALYALEFVLWENCSSNRVVEFMKQFLMGHYHLWFCFMIVGLYLVHPFINAICESKANRMYFLSIWLIFSIIIPTILQIPQLSKLQIVVDKLNLFLPLGYTGYWVLGYELASYEFRDKKHIRKIGFGLYMLGAALTFIGSLVVSYIMHEENAALLGYFTPNVLLEAVGLWLLFQSLNTEKQDLSVLSNNCFGIYLISDFFVLLLKHLTRNVEWISNTVYLIPLYAVIIFIVCAWLVQMIRKIPILGKSIL